MACQRAVSASPSTGDSVAIQPLAGDRGHDGDEPLDVVRGRPPDEH